MITWELQRPGTACESANPRPEDRSRLIHATRHTRPWRSQTELAHQDSQGRELGNFVPGVDRVAVRSRLSRRVLTPVT